MTRYGSRFVHLLRSALILRGIHSDRSQRYLRAERLVWSNLLGRLFLSLRFEHLPLRAISCLPLRNITDSIPFCTGNKGET
ncbi:hypothetical protein BJX68DRAFT_225689 [Aspergillus pseudodeflectus]|uniref:Uncharacterized protein n=1 Tax=Aspergillus pseudodeflectus TaxID=176178 RepID=A0ABR4L7U2_9EURO